MEKERFLGDLARQREYCAAKSAIYAGILAALEAELRGGEPAWFRRLQEAWAGRVFVPHYEAPLLLLTSLHLEALAGRAPALSAGTAIETLAAAPEAFWEELATARLQTNEAGRAVGWLLVSCLAFRTRGTPFHLVDLGTSAGLTLIGDYLPRDWTLRLPSGEPAAEPEGWKDAPYPVLSRLGLDARPRALRDPRDRLWLKAGIWPDDAERHRRFAAAADLFVRLENEANGPRLEACSFAEMPARLARLRLHPDEGLLVFNAQAADFLPEREYASLREGVGRALEPWGDRGFWAELEFPRGGGETHELRVHRRVGGRLETRVLAATTAHPREVTVLPGWDFLRPLQPPKPPRNTREEPPKTLTPGRYRFPGSEERHD